MTAFAAFTYGSTSRVMYVNVDHVVSVIESGDGSQITLAGETYAVQVNENLNHVITELRRQARLALSDEVAA